MPRPTASLVGALDFGIGLALVFGLRSFVCFDLAHGHAIMNAWSSSLGGFACGLLQSCLLQERSE
jgi:hypothetical protein